MEKRRFLVAVGLALIVALLVPQLAFAGQVYRVVPGDTLYRIAQRLGTTVDQLVETNHIENPDSVEPGQVLVVPGEGTTFVVKPGDTLFAIAQQVGLPMAALAQANNLNNWDNLYVGQVLTVPETEQAAAFQHSVFQLAGLFPGIFYLQGNSPGSRQIALTFDDGPDAVYTPQVLDVLRQYDVPATFFLMGGRVQQHPDVVQRIVAEGHVVGNHSWSHPDLRRVSAPRLKVELEETEAILAEITGRRTALMRPPYGAVSYDVISQLVQLDYRVINWSVDSKDWRDQSPDQVLANTLPDVKDGGIILLHSAGGEGQSMWATVEALPTLIEELKRQGYVFVTVDQLLGVPAYR